MNKLLLLFLGAIIIAIIAVIAGYFMFFSGTSAPTSTSALAPVSIPVAAPQTVKYVRVESDKGQPIEIAEIQAFENGVNVAQGKKANQSTTAFGGDAARAVDGNTAQSFWGPKGSAGSVSHTGQNTNQWWEVDLGRPADINKVVFWPRVDTHEGKEYGYQQNKYLTLILKNANGDIIGKYSIEGIGSAQTFKL